MCGITTAARVLGNIFRLQRLRRIASGDPRPSVEERYSSFGQYYSAVIRAIDGLVKDRFLLCEDTEAMQARLLQAGLDAGVPPPKGNLPPQSTLPHGQNHRANPSGGGISLGSGGKRQAWRPSACGGDAHAVFAYIATLNAVAWAEREVR